MHVKINTAAVDGAEVPISNAAAEAVRMGFNPSSLPRVDQLKALAAAFLSLCDEVAEDLPEAGREIATAKTTMQTASMWAVLGATKSS
ncbi:MAG: hypothetical protein AAF415_12890 [Pseudomonadota bacterium]